MAEVSLTAAFSTVPATEAEDIKRVIVETVQQLAQDDGGFKKARIVLHRVGRALRVTAELTASSARACRCSSTSSSSNTRNLAGRGPSSRKALRSTSAGS